MRYVRERTKEKGFHKCLMVMDAFKTHFTGYVVAAMLIGLTDVAKVTAGCISKVQPLDVCINKPFKSILRECWEDRVVTVVKDAGDEAKNNPSFKLSSLSRKDVVKWVHSGYVFLQNSRAMIQRSFEVCLHNHNKSRVG